MGTYATNPTGCSLWDIDEDGRDEAVIWNDRVMAVFETIGGKANWIFAKGSGYGYSVVGNDNVYWAGTAGDWNETNHTAALSDVSVGGHRPGARRLRVRGRLGLGQHGRARSSRTRAAPSRRRVSLTLG